MADIDKPIQPGSLNPPEPVYIKATGLHTQGIWVEPDNCDTYFMGWIIYGEMIDSTEAVPAAHAPLNQA